MIQTSNPGIKSKQGPASPEVPGEEIMGIIIMPEKSLASQSLGSFSGTISCNEKKKKKKTL